MAGILANSLSKTMVAGDTAADDQESDYVIKEKITLSTTPTGTDYQWSLTRPSTSTKAVLDSTSIASPVFTPDVDGVYLITVIVDSTTTFNLRATVLATSITNISQVLSYQPIKNASVPSPAGATLNMFNSNENAAMALKNSAGTVTSFGGGIDHDDLSGLTDDDHTQYLLVTGARAINDGAGYTNDTAPVVDIFTDIADDGTDVHDLSLPTNGFGKRVSVKLHFVNQSGVNKFLEAYIITIRLAGTVTIESIRPVVFDTLDDADNPTVLLALPEAAEDPSEIAITVSTTNLRLTFTNKEGELASGAWEVAAETFTLQATPTP